MINEIKPAKFHIPKKVFMVVSKVKGVDTRGTDEWTDQGTRFQEFYINMTYIKIHSYIFIRNSIPFL